MTIDVKGFVQIPEFRNNSRDSVAALGQLSMDSRTFARDRQVFQDTDNDISELVIFKCVDDGNYAILPTEVRDLCFDIVTKAYQEFTTSKSFSDQLEEAFPDLTGVDTGADKLHNGKSLTDWFTFKYDLAGEEVSVKLWMSDESFQQEYTEHEISIVAPVIALGDIHASYDIANTAIGAFTLLSRNTAEREIIADDPPTDTRIFELQWQDPTDTSKTIMTYWSIIGYGNAAFTYEAQLNAIKEYLVANSVWDLADWATYFPDLVSVDAIYLFPQWDNVSLSSSTVPGEGDQQYSTIVRYDTGMTNLRKIITDATLTSMKKYTDVISAVYKSIAVMSVGKETNEPGRQSLYELFPDYTVLSVNNGSLGRNSQATIDFTEHLNRVLTIAESDDGAVALPTGYVRQVTGGATFIEFTLNNTVFRLCTKKTYLAII